MKPQDIRDLGSTIAGGGAGVAMLLTVNWAGIPHGESVKLGVAVLLILLGYLMYKHNPPAPPPAPTA